MLPFWFQATWTPRSMWQDGWLLHVQQCRHRSPICAAKIGSGAVSIVDPRQRCIEAGLLNELFHFYSMYPQTFLIGEQSRTLVLCWARIKAINLPKRSLLMSLFQTFSAVDLCLPFYTETWLLLMASCSCFVENTAVTRLVLVQKGSVELSWAEVSVTICHFF